jgi:hypothetical protein
MHKEEKSYSLNNHNNYKLSLTASTNEIETIYSDIVMEYYSSMLETMRMKNIKLKHFIIIRGLDTIKNVFCQMLYYTKNIHLTYFYCQKAYYFYIEFIEQITDDDKLFLQLTSRDATCYVYKKTVFELETQFKLLEKKHAEYKVNSLSFKETMEKINKYIKLSNTYMIKIIQCSEKLLKYDTSTNEEQMNEKNITQYKSFCELLIAFLNEYSSRCDLLSQLENNIEKLFYDEDNINTFFQEHKKFYDNFSIKRT